MELRICIMKFVIFMHYYRFSTHAKLVQIPLNSHNAQQTNINMETIVFALASSLRQCLQFQMELKPKSIKILPRKLFQFILSFRLISLLVNSKFDIIPIFCELNYQNARSKLKPGQSQTPSEAGKNPECVWVLFSFWS